MKDLRKNYLKFKNIKIFFIKFKIFKIQRVELSPLGHIHWQLNCIDGNGQGHNIVWSVFIQQRDRKCPVKFNRNPKFVLPSMIQKGNTLNLW